jgi:alkanesulfonate monooxygenase
MNLRFHWSMSAVGDAHRGAKDRSTLQWFPDFDELVSFCRHAEECGIDSLLTAVGVHRPDPIALASALGMLTTRIKFMVAVRSGLISPTAFVQQVNTVAALTNGRICINVVAGHTPAEQAAYGDFLAHDDRYARTDEFLAICNALWKGDGPVTFDGRFFRVENAKLNAGFTSPERGGPEVFVGGASAQAADLAIRHGHCLWILPEKTETLRAHIAPVLDAGVEAGLLISIHVRPTRDEAVQSASMMVEKVREKAARTHENFEKRSDSVAWRSAYELARNESHWLTETLWTGAVPYLGAPAIALVGSPDDVAGAILDYKAMGISQFLFMGWPDAEAMTIFARDVLPIIRREEASDAKGNVA